METSEGWIVNASVPLRALTNRNRMAADAIARSLQVRLDAMRPGYFVQHERFTDPVNDHIHLQFGPPWR